MYISFMVKGFTVAVVDADGYEGMDKHSGRKMVLIYSIQPVLVLSEVVNKASYQS